MTKEKAKQLLKYHSFTHKDINHPKMEKGFLGMLRPFRGELIEENYHEIMEAIKVLADELRDQPKIDREVISAIWGICDLTRSWALSPNGMLQRNNLINQEQIGLLDNWIGVISNSMMFILDGADDETAFNRYQRTN